MGLLKVIVENTDARGAVMDRVLKLQSLKMLADSYATRTSGTASTVDAGGGTCCGRPWWCHVFRTDPCEDKRERAAASCDECLRT